MENDDLIAGLRAAWIEYGRRCGIAASPDPALRPYKQDVSEARADLEAVAVALLADADAEIARARQDGIAAMILAYEYLNMDELENWATIEDAGWRVERWPTWKQSLTEEHSGDCTQQAHSCLRCQAEHITALAKQIDAVARAALAARARDSSNADV